MHLLMAPACGVGHARASLETVLPALPRYRNVFGRYRSVTGCYLLGGASKM